MISQKMLSKLRRCVEDYDMLREGDVVAVGLSGGKDSLVMLAALQKLSSFYPEHFTVKAISIGLERDMSAYDRMDAYCRELGVEYIRVPSDIREIVFDRRREPNPCSLCANMRRGALNRAAVAAGCNKVALGHHADDAVETFLMSLFYEGRISCFEPVTYLSRADVTVIRPMLYATERDMRAEARRVPTEVVKNPCPANGLTKRQDTKELIFTLSAQYASLREKIFGAMQRLPLSGWEKTPRSERIRQEKASAESPAK